MEGLGMKRIEKFHKKASTRACCDESLCEACIKKEMDRRFEVILAEARKERKEREEKERE